MYVNNCDMWLGGRIVGSFCQIEVEGLRWWVGVHARARSATVVCRKCEDIYMRGHIRLFYFHQCAVLFKMLASGRGVCPACHLWGGWKFNRWKMVTTESALKSLIGTESCFCFLTTARGRAVKTLPGGCRTTKHRISVAANFNVRMKFILIFSCVLPRVLCTK